jgi:sulfatase maturation enzyme AslB (radical SAM superfamily)
VTEDCNYECTYCYQKKGKISVRPSSVKKAIDFFSPYLKNPCYINFYGGEPLMAFDTIMETLRYTQDRIAPQKDVRYTLTTNGSLLTERHLEILDEFNFQLVLSFDGLAQNFSRKKGSFRQMVRIIEKTKKYPKIILMTHSVYTPETIQYLSDSMKFIDKLGVESINFNLSYITPWDSEDLELFKRQMEELSRYIIQIYDPRQSLRFMPFRKSERLGLAVCHGGRDQICLNADDTLWGCVLFQDYAKWIKNEDVIRKYSFGKLDFFIKEYKTVYPKILQNYSSLDLLECRSDENPCPQCIDLLDCFICPLAAAFGSYELGKIPGWVCAIRRIFKEENAAFWEQLKSAPMGD